MAQRPLSQPSYLGLALFAAVLTALAGALWLISDWMDGTVAEFLPLIVVSGSLIGFGVWHVRRRAEVQKSLRSSSSAAAAGIVSSDHVALPVLLSVCATQFTGFRTGGLVNPSLFAFLLLALYWAYFRIANLKQPVRLTAFAWLMVAYFIELNLPSTIKLSLFNGPLSIAPKLLVAVFILDLVQTPRQLRKCFVALFASVGIGAVAAIIQYIAANHYGIVWNLADAHVSWRPGGILRATAFAGSPARFATPVAVVVAMAVALLVTRATRGRQRIMLFLVVVGIAALYCSSSRSTWIALAATLCVLPFIVWPKATPLWVVLAGLGITASLQLGLVESAMKSVSSVRAGSVIERQEVLKVGLRALTEKPVQGVGVNNFSSYYLHPHDYPVHTGWLQIGSETGLPGLLIYLAIWLLVLFHLMQALRSVSDPQRRGEVIAVIAGLFTLLGAMQSETAGWSFFYYLFLALCEGCALAVLKESPTAVLMRRLRRSGGATPRAKLPASAEAASS